MQIEKTLDQLHEFVTKITILQIFTSFTRVLLAIGFIPPSIKKILNEPFTILPDSHPVGHYFNALYQTGFYYQFLGWAQVIAAVLLLFPRTAHLGALMFLPIIVNIAVLTTSVGFTGTWIITIMMSLAALYLVCWDYDRLKPILFQKRSLRAAGFKYELFALTALSFFGGMAGFTVLGLVAFGNRHTASVGRLLIVGSICSVFGLMVALHHRFMRVGSLENINEKL